MLLPERKVLLHEFGWKLKSIHPAYSPYLAASDFHLFPMLKPCLGGRRFESFEKVEDAAKLWLNGLATAVYDEGIQN
jgi:hypothetical protein